MRNHPIFAFVALALLVPGAAAAPSGPSRIDYEYALGALAEGRITGNLTATAYYFPEKAADSLQFTSDGGTWTRYTVEFNYTVLRPDHPEPDWWEVSRRMWSTTQEVPAGPATLSWPETGSARIFGSPGPRGPGVSTFNVGFSTQALRSGPITQGAPFEYYVEKDEGPVKDAAGKNIYSFWGGVRGHNRYVTFSDGTLRVADNLTLYVEQATLRVAPGFETSLPPRRENVSQTPMNPGARWMTVRQTFAFFDVRNAHLELPAAHRDVLGQALEARVAGSVSASKASGRLDARNQSATFSEQELKVTGSFQWVERPASDLGGAPTMVRAEQEGQFTQVNIDLAAALVAPDPWNAAEKIGLIATLAAVAFGLWKLAALLFSRLRDDEMDKHEIRRNLLEAIRQRPGLGIKRLADLIGVAANTASYHLTFMEDHGVVGSKKIAGERKFFAAAMSKLPDARLHKEHDEVLALLMERIPKEGMPLADAVRLLQTEFEFARSSAYEAVQRAERVHLLRRVKSERGWWLQSA